jgi:dihydrolipoamide dehydrogenase
LRGGVSQQMKRFKVDVKDGRAEILSAPSGPKAGAVRVHLNTGTVEEHEYSTLLIATGSLPILPPIAGARDNPLVVDSTGLLSVASVPKRLAVIGGGVIGVEFAGLFAALGSEVTVIEMMNEIIPFMDKEQAPLFRKALKGVHFKLECKVEKIEGAAVHYTTTSSSAEKTESDLVLMAVGRRPVLTGWGAEAAGVDLTNKGIRVDERMRTNIPGIWAAGDVTGRSLLAHSAYRMAEVAVADMLYKLDGGDAPQNIMRYDAVPWVVYGMTEAAGVGITEQAAESAGIHILKASVPMSFSGRFIAENTLQGIGSLKVIADAASRRILGIHAVGAYASEFIWGGAALIEQEFRIEDLKQLIVPHPTVCELIRDAVWEL